MLEEQGPAQEVKRRAVRRHGRDLTNRGKQLNHIYVLKRAFSLFSLSCGGGGGERWGRKPAEKTPGEPREPSPKSACRAEEEGCFRDKSHGAP